MRLLYFGLSLLTLSASLLAENPFRYVPAPADNPLKGLVPYARPIPDRFPHSMEFSYLPLSDLMLGPNDFNWQPLETLLDDIASRGHQAVFRVWVEYPGRTQGIPSFLEDQGVKVVTWVNENTAPLPPKRVRTPDYADPRMRKALTTFIEALGQKYDGDPRIGFITAGLLGTWGEWHTYPRTELMASKEVQAEVMDAYEVAFDITPVLLRYPAGVNSEAYASNDTRSFGYHDDSFAWATLDTGREEDDWFFVPALMAAGPNAFNKWRTQPIGGEIRPELWGRIFDDENPHPRAQSFSDCVQQTHVTWLMDTGMFREPPSEKRRANAIAQVQAMGYEFHIFAADRRQQTGGEIDLSIRLSNKGVAPFYYPWKVELAVLEGDRVVEQIPVDWSVMSIIPGDYPTTWQVRLRADQIPKEGERLGVRIVNPLPGGIPLRFANVYENESTAGWWPVPWPAD